MIDCFDTLTLVFFPSCFSLLPHTPILLLCPFIPPFTADFTSFNQLSHCKYKHYFNIS